MVICLLIFGNFIDTITYGFIDNLTLTKSLKHKPSPLTQTVSCNRGGEKGMVRVFKLPKIKFF